MDWKRIMNREKRWKETAGDSSVQTDLPHVTEEEIKEYLAGLLGEWNFRLLTEADALADQILWVESASVTAYQPSPEKEPSGKPEFGARISQGQDGENAEHAAVPGGAGGIKRRLMGWIEKHLTGRRNFSALP